MGAALAENSATRGSPQPRAGTGRLRHLQSAVAAVKDVRTGGRPAGMAHVSKDDLSLGPHSPYKSNWELSVARAFSVITFLTSQEVDPAKISARGYGPYRPRVPNTSPANRARW